MKRESKFKDIKAKNLKKDSQIKMQGMPWDYVFVENVKKVKTKMQKFILHKDGTERKEFIAEIKIVATVYKYCYENAYEDLVFSPNQIINVRKFTRRELKPSFIDYTSPGTTINTRENFYDKMHEKRKSGIKLEEINMKNEFEYLFNLKPENAEKRLSKEILDTIISEEEKMTDKFKD